MTGELHDFVYPNEPKEYFTRQTQSGYVMMAALCLDGLYYIIIKGFGLLKPSEEVVEMYNDTGLQPRYPFRTWREYENIQ
jgi:hypothetical protein